jgi:hypothetical protein
VIAKNKINKQIERTVCVKNVNERSVDDDGVRRMEEVKYSFVNRIDLLVLSSVLV